MRSAFPNKIFAKKSFGQNFLVDENYISRIISALEPQKGETIIEIGAGRGALTKGLIESGANIIAIELERDMIAVLQREFVGAENFQLVEADALKVNFSEIMQNSKFKDKTPKSKLIANLPYYISTAILQKLIEQRAFFSEMILMFQREVVERITAQVGNSERGFLSVLVQNYLAVEKFFDVPPQAFRPAPKVESAVVRLQPKNENSTIDEAFFRELVSASFAQKRKTIFNNLKNSPPAAREKLGDLRQRLEACGIVPERRAETLTTEEWRRLSNYQ